MSTTPPAAPATRSRAQRLRGWAIDIGIVALVFFALQAWMTRDVLRGALPPLDAPLVGAAQATAAQWQQAHGASGYVLYVWATWCPICKTVEGSVDRVAADLPLLTVAMSSGAPAAVQGFLQQRGHDWPTLLDGDGRLSARLGVDAVPTLLFVNGRGEVRAVTQGYTSELGIRLRWLWLRAFG